MASNYLFAGRQNPIDQLIEGFGAGQQLIGNINQQQMANIKNQMLQNELTKQEAVKNALAQPNIDPMQVMRADPALGLQIANLQKSIDKEQIDKLASVAKLTETYGPMMLTNPQIYPQFKGMVDKIIPGNMLPEFNSFVDQQGNFDQKKFTGFASMLIPDVRKEIVKPVTPHFTGMTYGPQGQPIQNYIDPRTLKQGAIPLAGTKDYGTETLVPLDGKGRAIVVNKVPGQEYPAGYGPMGQVRIDMGRTTPEGVNNILDMLQSGEMYPSQLSKRAADYNQILSQSKDRGINLAKLANEEQSAKTFARNMNTQRMNQFRMFASTINSTIQRVRELTDAMDLSGFRPLNYAEIEAKMKLEGNTEAGKLATAYVSQINGLRAELYQTENAGFAPTQDVMKLVNEQINRNYGVKQMHTALDEVDRLIKYRVKAVNEMGPMFGGAQTSQFQQPIQPQPTKQAIPPKLEEQFYNQTKAQIMAMPPGQKRDQKLQQLEDMRKAQRGQ